MVVCSAVPSHVLVKARHFTIVSFLISMTGFFHVETGKRVD